MTALILRRLLLLPVLLFVIYTVTFALAWLIPGNPLEQDGRRPPPEVAEAMLAQYNLNSPWAFYWDYLGKATGVSWLAGKAGLGAGHARPFDLGPSLQHQDWTVTAGVIGAVRPGSWSDTVTLGVALIGISLPAFVTGTVLLIVFAFMLGWFPVAGWGTPGHLVLPAITLALPPAAYIARLTRFGMIEQLRQDYIRTARAKGAPEHRVVLHHALKNALLPVLSYLGPAAAAAMTGSFVVEKVFAVPGVGTHFVDAVLGKDLTMIMGVVIVYATMLILFNLVVDVLYAWIDPRIRVT